MHIMGVCVFMFVLADALGQYRLSIHNRLKYEGASACLNLYRMSLGKCRVRHIQN